LPRDDHFADLPRLFCACFAAKINNTACRGRSLLPAEDSLFPLFPSSENVVEDQLLGLWIVSDQAKAGKLALSSVTIGDHTVLMATTKELRKFALQHAEDRKAFAEPFAFQRKK
jgi:hypothetical protein